VVKKAKEVTADDQADETIDEVESPVVDDSDPPTKETDTSAVSETTGSTETAPAEPQEAPLASPPVKPRRSVGARIRDIEKRWGKNFEDVIIDLHDHVFGASPEHNESDAPPVSGKPE
jgi:hypothetical protein